MEYYRLRILKNFYSNLYFLEYFLTRFEQTLSFVQFTNCIGNVFLNSHRGHEQSFLALRTLLKSWQRINEKITAELPYRV
jgi:hypothetical protein